MIDSILSALGYLGDSLDKPGRAVRGLLSGNAREGLAAVPFSDSMGLTDPSQRTSGRDLLSALGVDPGEGTMGDLAGFGAEVATDPLTLLGAGLGAKAGLKAGGAAMARGPRYGTTAVDLERMMLEGGGEPGHNMLQALMRSPAADRIASEVPEGSQFLGNGAEAVAFKSPTGDVIRLARGGGEGRPVAEGVLQPTRTVDVPGGGMSSFRAERVPAAEGIGDPALRRRDPATMLTGFDQLDQTLKPQGLAFTDRHPGNVGTVAGKPTVIDPGAIDALPHFAGGYSPVTQAGQPGAMSSLLLDMLGGDDAVRAAIEAGRNPNFLLGGTVAGTGAGSVMGAGGRAFAGRGY